MADYTKQIFELLGVKPEEEFKIKGKNNALPYPYKLTEKLETYSYDADEDRWRRLYTDEVLKDVLNGTYKIIKIPHPTAEEQLAIDYARACGCKWIAKDSDGTVNAFDKKPEKEYYRGLALESQGHWNTYDRDSYKCFELLIDISFIHWEDEEPFYIGD